MVVEYEKTFINPVGGLPPLDAGLRVGHWMCCLTEDEIGQYGYCNSVEIQNRHFRDIKVHFSSCPPHGFFDEVLGTFQHNGVSRYLPGGSGRWNGNLWVRKIPSRLYISESQGIDFERMFFCAPGHTDVDVLDGNEFAEGDVIVRFRKVV